MKKGMIRKLLATSVLACMVPASQAAEVEWWTYAIDMKWTAASFDSAEVGYESTSYASGLHPTMLSWGHRSGLDDYLVAYTGHSQVRSSLNIATDATFRKDWSGYYGPNGVHNGQSVVNMFRHTNNAIPWTSADLRYAQLTMSVDLGAFDGTSYVPVPSFEIEFDIYFYETSNFGANVDDVLLFANTGGSYKFNHDGEWYAFNYSVLGLTEIDAATCSNVSKGALTGSCWGFTTPEYARSTPQMGFSIQATTVPEPETYAMLLAGLGIVGAVARRRRNAIR